MVIDHLGIVVKSIDAGVHHWINLFGYTQYTEIVENSRQKVKVVFLKKDHSLTIKLVEPVGVSSPIFEFAQRGGGLHHICFKCDKLEETIASLKDKGAMSLVPPQPGEAFENENIAFLLTNQHLNIELIDTDKKARMI